MVLNPEFFAKTSLDCSQGCHSFLDEDYLLILPYVSEEEERGGDGNGWVHLAILPEKCTRALSPLGVGLVGLASKNRGCLLIEF